MAITGLMPANRISSGVIREPPPMPVVPTRMPTPRPKTTIIGSTGSGLPGRGGCGGGAGARRRVQAALGLVLARPAALAPRAGQRAGGAADRGVPAVVQRVVG